jgi:hypothetical protein
MPQRIFLKVHLAGTKFYFNQDLCSSQKDTGNKGGVRSTPPLFPVSFRELRNPLDKEKHTGPDVLTLGQFYPSRFGFTRQKISSYLLCDILVIKSQCQD